MKVAIEDPEVIRKKVIDGQQTVFDPEIPVNVYELGLIYGVTVAEGGATHIRMTLTSPMCPVAETLPPEVEAKVRGVEGVKNVALDVMRHRVVLTSEAEAEGKSSDDIVERVLVGILVP